MSLVRCSSPTKQTNKKTNKQNEQAFGLRPGAPRWIVHGGAKEGALIFLLFEANKAMDSAAGAGLRPKAC